MHEQQQPTFYTLWFRESADRPWVPLRRTRTYSDAVKWVGVEHTHAGASCSVAPTASQLAGHLLRAGEASSIDVISTTA